MKGITLMAITSLFLLTGWGSASAQKKDDKADKAAKVTKWMEKKRYVFQAQNVTPMSGRMRMLTSEYDVRISPDTIISYLPYFGRAFSPGVTLNTDGGIKFTSTKFEYTSTVRKKGGWDVSIKFSDVPEVQQFNFTIFDDGTSTLQVTSTNRQPISFSGYLMANKMKKKKK